MLNHLQKPSIIGGAVILALAVAYVATLSPDTPAKELTTVTVGDIVQEVLVTGAVRAAQSASLSFDRGGRVVALPIPVGEAVTAGALVAVLENNAEQAAVAEAEAGVASAENKFQEKKRGTRLEELRVKEADRAKAEIMFMNLQEKTSLILTDAYNNADVALNRLADPLFSNDDSTAPRLTFSSGNQSGVYRAETERISAGNNLRALKALIASEAGGSETRLTQSLLYLRAVAPLFLTLGDILTDASGLGEGKLADYKERAGTARANVTAALTAAQNHLNALREASASAEKARRELTLAEAGSTPEEILGAEQTLRQAQAKLSAAHAALEKTFLRAPFSGRIASKHVERGETVSAGNVVMDLLGTGGFIIEANVPEADITKMKAGDAAAVTLDAYGNETRFRARVTRIEPGETVVDGVPTYKTTFAFLDNDETKPRSGMTANILLRTIVKEDALMVPQKAIIEQEDKKFVRVLKSKKPMLAEVRIGERSEDGMVELLAGVAAGEKILIEKDRK